MGIELREIDLEGLELCFNDHDLVYVQTRFLPLHFSSQVEGITKEGKSNDDKKITKISFRNGVKIYGRFADFIFKRAVPTFED